MGWVGIVLAERTHFVGPLDVWAVLACVLPKCAQYARCGVTGCKPAKAVVSGCLAPAIKGVAECGRVDLPSLEGGFPPLFDKRYSRGARPCDEVRKYVGRAGPTFVLFCPFVVCARGCPPHLSVFYGQFGYYPVLAERRHRFLASAVPSIPILVARARHRFLWPGGQCSDNAKCDFALVLVFYIGGLERCMILASMGFSDAIWGIGHSERLMMALMIPSHAFWGISFGILHR